MLQLSVLVGRHYPFLEVDFHELLKARPSYLVYIVVMELSHLSSVMM
jgi:hypothetical protein